MQRVILHCDMNNFYASVECMLNPELKNKPVAVCGSVEERHGIVLAKNYAAKAFGVSTGEAIWQAKQKCQDLVIVEPHYEQYMKFSKLARGIYGRYTDQIEPYGMDECWLDVTGSGCMGTGFEIADEIRRTVKFELGLTISAGVSFNKIFAKLGSDMKKPDAITCIEADSFREKIWCLPASDLLGVGRATEKVLSGYGIHTIGELAATSDDFLKCRLGKNGLAIKKYANGLDDSPVMRSDYVSPVKSIGHGITTMQDLENNAEVWCVMLELVQEIGTKLRTHKKKAGGIAISMLTVNALAAANRIIIPVQAEYLPAKGLEQLLSTVSKVKRQINPKLQIDGILLTMVDNRTNFAKEIAALLRDTYGSKIKVFGTEIPHSVRAKEISAEGKSIFAHDPGGKVAEGYRNLTKEVLKLEKQREKNRAGIGR